jgi:hypothetical protein
MAPVARRNDALRSLRTSGTESARLVAPGQPSPDETYNPSGRVGPSTPRWHPSPLVSESRTLKESGSVFGVRSLPRDRRERCQIHGSPRQAAASIRERRSKGLSSISDIGLALPAVVHAEANRSTFAEGMFDSDVVMTAGLRPHRIRDEFLQHGSCLVSDRIGHELSTMIGAGQEDQLLMD